MGQAQAQAVGRCTLCGVAYLGGREAGDLVDYPTAAWTIKVPHRPAEHSNLH